VNPPDKKTQIKVVLLDIEGTTTPIDFVYHVLFPYARTHIPAYIRNNFSSPTVLADLASLVSQNGEDRRLGLDPPYVGSSSQEITAESAADYLLWLMDRDSKATPLKSIQGKIWEAGYREGSLHSQVFDDVPPAMNRWRRTGKNICIYSSGSVLAQKLLFANTESGDLTGLIGGFYDTNMGGKRHPGSYQRIADDLGISSQSVLFISDVTAELDAALNARLQTLLCVRPGNPPQPADAHHSTIKSFDEVSL
jgi:enolase-phosphatase E1